MTTPPENYPYVIHMHDRESTIKSLHTAIHLDRLDVIEYILEKGYTCLNLRKWMFTHSASIGSIDIIKFLINKQYVPDEITLIDGFEFAVRFGRFDIVKFFIDTRYVSNETIGYCLHVAAIFNHIEIIKLMLNEEVSRDNIQYAIKIAIEARTPSTFSNKEEFNLETNTSIIKLLQEVLYGKSEN